MPLYMDSRYASDLAVRPLARSPTRPTLRLSSLPTSRCIVYTSNSAYIQGHLRDPNAFASDPHIALNAESCKPSVRCSRTLHRGCLFYGNGTCSQSLTWFRLCRLCLHTCVGCCPGPSPALMMVTDDTAAAVAEDPAWKCLSTMTSA